MKKNRIKVYLLALGIILFLIMGGNDIAKVQAADDVPSADDYYFTIGVGAKEIYNGGELDISGDAPIPIYIKKKGGVDVGLDIRWNSSNDKAITITPDNDLKHWAYMERVGPGYSMISATIKDAKTGIYVDVSCMIKAELAINKSKTTLTKLTDETREVMVLDEGESSQIFLKYIADSSEIKNFLVDWESSNTAVATVSGGMVTAVGAGSTTITIKTQTKSNQLTQQTLTLDVIVCPTAEDPADSVKKNDFTINLAQGITNYKIKTNASRASYLTWEIYDSKKKLVNNDLMTYVVGQGNNVFEITDVKAGTYDIYAYVNGYKSEKDFIAPLHIKLEVPINVTIEDVIMNTGDTADIFKNSNLPPSTVFSYKITDSANSTTGNPVTNVIKFSGASGIITAQSKGIAYLHFTTPPIGYIKVTVIDGIALSMTEASIYTGGTLELIATVSNTASAIPVTWKSSNEAVATVKDGMVLGISEGTTTITASQTINGVNKTATCIVTVQTSVASITIYPSTIDIDINEKKTLTATIVPENLKNVNLKWFSSDPGVVAIDKANNLSASIIGKSGGTAMVFAINQDNIIVGFCKVTVPIKVNTITLSETSVTASKNTPDLQLRATVNPNNATNPSIKWSSLNPSVATVSATGLVKFVGPGSTSIIATSVSDPTITAVCNVTVVTSATSLVLDETKKTMYVGETTRLTYLILPANTSSKELVWSSSNTAVVTVDANGMLSAKKAGEAVITVKLKDGTLSQTCTVTVVQKAEGVKLDVKDLQLNIGQTYTIKPTFTPADSTETLTWDSSDKTIATVDASGKVTGVSVGKAVIVAKTKNGETVYCNVVVKEAVTGVKLNFEEKTIVLGETFKLKATVLPSTATSLDVTWKISNPKIVSISSTGTVKALANGVAVITCTTNEGKYTATCVVQVIEPVTKIKLNKTSQNLGVGRTYTLKATVTSNSATNPKVQWISSNKKIATVNSQGKVTAKKTGYVTITARALDKSGAEASCDFRIVKGVTSISLNRNTLTLVEGRDYSLKATIKPKNATYKTATWKSSNEEVAIVSTNGKITALTEGKTIITATAKDGSGKTAKCHVIVKKVTPASSVTILNKNLTMIAGESTTLQKAINPSGSTDRYTWESDNKAVATVNKSTGKVTAHSPGIANVTIMTESGKTATTKVTVVGLNSKSIVLEQYSQYQLEVIGLDSFSDSGTPNVTWQVANSEIAVVKGGLVESRRIGTTTITAIVNGRRLTCKLKVVKIK